jgi:lipoyl(octanoyl) transferase
MNLRIIIDPPQSPAFNMAADRYLLSHPETDTLVLRLYQWNGPAISLGQAQNPDMLLDMPLMVKENIAWVVRPTGGREVLHANDLTYAVAFGLDCTAMGKTIAATYKTIADCLCSGLACAGIPAQPHDSTPDPQTLRPATRLPCFLAANRDEIMADDRKLVGSAQKRTSAGVLQHGSIPLTMDFTKLPRYSLENDSRKNTVERQLKTKCTCIHNHAPGIHAPELAKHLIAGFEKVLECNGVHKNWTTGELRDINELYAKNRE